LVELRLGLLLAVAIIIAIFAIINIVV